MQNRIPQNFSVTIDTYGRVTHRDPQLAERFHPGEDVCTPLPELMQMVIRHGCRVMENQPHRTMFIHPVLEAGQFQNVEIYRKHRSPHLRLSVLTLGPESQLRPNVPSPESQVLLEKLNAYRDAYEELEQFAYTVTHDLREPLKNIANFSQLLQRQMPDELATGSKDVLDQIIESTKRMEKFTRDLLAYYVLKKGEEVTIDRINPTQMIEEIRQDLSVQFEGTSLQLGCMPTHIYGNSTRLKQLFQNLLTNALKFQHPGRNHEVVVRGFAQENGWKFEVQDNGIGIALREQERIFKLFGRAEQASNYQGSGIGLSLCQLIVEQHGGKIWLTSKPNQGTTFFFTLKNPEKTTDQLALPFT
ncbi:ATP-binding protein [Pontibacter sp. G13]|uniref:sensor histidine kinase n=1 Tax=Pontibacter sp. G13 TaxID=3074898 RepID=UPI00288ABE46|nr:ATP-binding protein [Pontibacter sp. G13]WNJ16637.1 ATP-binding protein [Pontibacter sp. G13]